LQSTTIQIKATEQFFPLVLFIMLYKVHVVLTFESVDKILFIFLYKVALSFESVDEILKCGHLSERF